MSRIVHENRVFYRSKPTRYRQIVLLGPPPSFEVRIFEGTVLKAGPFDADNDLAEQYDHANLAEAEDDVRAECDQSTRPGVDG